VNNVRVRLIIEGRVQGVWFRESTRREAVSLRVFGWVKNLPGGAVETLIEGPEY
jgi:acylphosphatase